MTLVELQTDSGKRYTFFLENIGYVREYSDTYTTIQLNGDSMEIAMRYDAVMSAIKEVLTRTEQKSKAPSIEI